MEFCPHCGLHLKGRKDYCRSCGPAVCWWFENKEILAQLGLKEEESWRDENGEMHPRGWERKDDGRFHPYAWKKSTIDGRYYPFNWLPSKKDGIYRPRDWRGKIIQTT